MYICIPFIYYIYSHKSAESIIMKRLIGEGLENVNQSIREHAAILHTHIYIYIN